MKTIYLIQWIIVLVISFLVEYFFSFSKEFLIPIAASLMLVTSVGNVIFQDLFRYLFILLIVVLYTVFFSSHPLLYPRIYDVSLGALIGILVNLLVFPRHADREFREALLPILITYENYFSSIIDLFLGKEAHLIESQQIAMELSLKKFPTWVYKRGFDVGLQTSYRYFLGKMFQLAEVLFAMHYTVRQPTDKKLIKKIRAPLMECVSRLQILFKALITVIQLKKLTEGVEDLQNELYELEMKVQSLMPSYLELIDLPREFSHVYEFTYALRDLRNVLIKLAQALR